MPQGYSHIYSFVSSYALPRITVVKLLDHFKGFLGHICLSSKQMKIININQHLMINKIIRFEKLVKTFFESGNDIVAAENKQEC